MIKSIFYVAIVMSVFACSNIVSTKTTIAIQPFESIDTTLLNTIANKLEEKYNIETIILGNIELPETCYYKPRNRYRADKLLAYLKTIKPKEAKYILGITNKDISTTVHQQKDFGIFGLGYCPGKSCIVSTHRIKHQDNSVFISRLLKISLHEVGHNFGLKHCPNKNCLMTDAEKSIKTIDNAKLNICSDCNQKIN